MTLRVHAAPQDVEKWGVFALEWRTVDCLATIDNEVGLHSFPNSARNISVHTSITPARHPALPS